MPAESLYSLLCKKENAHEDPIYCCAWTTIKPIGDSKEAPQDYIVTGGLDGLIKVWKLNNKLQLLHTLQGHCLAVISIAISPDGYTIATTSLDSKLIIWELTSGNKVHEIDNCATDTWKVTFSTDGNQIVTSGHAGKLIIYSVEKKDIAKVLDTRGTFAQCVAWSKDNKHIASGAVDGKVCIFDVAQGKLVHTLEAHTQSVTSVDFSPNCKLIVTASKDGFVKLFDVASGNHQCSLALKEWVLSASFSPDGKRIASGIADGVVSIAAVDGLKILYSFHEHTSMVCGVQFNGKSKKVVSVSKDKAINLYQCPLPKTDNK